MRSRLDAAVVLIGNELLTGRIRDENLHFLAHELWKLGVPVRAAQIIRDSIDEIASTVATLSKRHAYLFTTGGIGPTHDDVTIEGVARAFGVKVVHHPLLLERIETSLGGGVTEAHRKMACVPEGAILEAGEENVWPTIRIEDTYVLPGVPSILRRKFVELRERFRQAPLFRSMIGLGTTETRIAGLLERNAARFPCVEIGSYPQADHVQVTFEGDQEDEVERARAAVEAETSDIVRSSGH